MKIFVISMKSYKERRKFQIRQAAKLNLEISFIDAVEGSEISNEKLQAAANKWTRPIFSKDVGCYLSHRKAWEKVSKENKKCLVLEDDVIISSEIQNFIKVIDSLNDSWNTAYDLEYAPGKHVLSKKNFYKDNNNLIEIKEIYRNKTGLAAYILGPQLASKMLKDLNSYVMVDASFWSRSWAQYMQVEPAPVVQMMHVGKETKTDESSIRNVRDINFINSSWLSRKFIRLKISLSELPSIIKGYLKGDRRELVFKKEEFKVNFDLLINETNQIN